MTRLKRKLPLALITGLSLLLFFYEYLSVYEIPITSLVGYSVVGIVLIGLLIPWKCLQLPFYLLVTVGILYSYIPLETPFSMQWLQTLIGLVGNQLTNFVTGNLGYIPTELAMVLIVILMIILAQLQIEFEHILFSSCIIIVYFILVASFNGEDLSWKIIYICCSGLLFKMLVDNRKYPALIIGILSIFLLAIVSLYLPNKAIQDPLLSVTSDLRNHLNNQGFYQLLEGNSGGDIKKSGFSENDVFLGGPLADDHQIVFEARQRNPRYWLVETKFNYIETGWTSDGNLRSTDMDSQNTAVLNRSNNDYQGPYKETEIIDIAFQQSGNYLPLPYGIEQIVNVTGNTEFEIYPEISRINFFREEERQNLQLTVSELDYSYEDLASVEVNDNLPGEYSNFVSTLPSRVWDLARELTDEEDSLIGKVLAVENYLKNSGNFRYSKIDASVTPSGEDYVDHFLFETQVGYCDNFSSAMVVLLRTLGIPARWAKGFASGEIIGEEGDQQIYAIRNSDAHSWPEVYFEGFGWLPFEPTPTFSGRDETTESTEQEESTTEESSEDEVIQTTTSTNMTEESSSETIEENTDREEQTNSTISVTMILVGILILIIIFLYFSNAWFSLLIISVKNPLKLIYPLILRKTRKILPRPEHQTLAEYARKVEKETSIFEGDFVKLTSIYENYLYNKGMPMSKEELKIMHAVFQKLYPISKK